MIQSQAKDSYMWDTALKGFGLKITPKGRKVFIVQYRVAGQTGRTRRITLGPSHAVTAEQARSQAKQFLSHAALGVDPAAERDAAKADHTLGALYEKFDAEHISVRLKPNTAADYRRIFASHILPRLANTPVGQIAKRDMLQLHHDMRTKPFRANRSVSVLSKFFNWCEQHGYRDEHSNPTRFVQKYKEPPRQRFLSADEQARLGLALAQAEKEELASPYTIGVLKLLCFTGARLGEVLGLRWSDVNWERGTLDLPDSKTGAKSIYLNEAAIELLKNTPKQMNNPYVFCGRDAGKPIVNIQKPWRRIRALAGLDDVRIHDLRHTFASIAAMGGMSLQMIGALLGHSQPQTTARYAHLAADPMRRAAEIVGRDWALD